MYVSAVGVKDEANLTPGLGDREDLVTKSSQHSDTLSRALSADTGKAMMKLDQ